MKNELVLVKKENGKEVPLTTSVIVAKETQNSHSSITRVINNYENDFKEFGIIRFKIEKSNRGRPIKNYYLNENQFLLLSTYLRNNVEVRKIKIAIVKQFSKMKEVLNEKKTLAWQETRQLGKQETKDMNDIVKAYVEYAKNQGSSKPNMYYKHFATLSNKSVNIEDGKRDLANHKKLFTQIAVMGIIKETIEQEMESVKPYKEIYKDCKKQIEGFMEYLPATLRLN